MASTPRRTYRPSDFYCRTFPSFRVQIPSVQFMMDAFQEAGFTAAEDGKPGTTTWVLLVHDRNGPRGFTARGLRMPLVRDDRQTWMWGVFVDQDACDLVERFIIAVRDGHLDAVLLNELRDAPPVLWFGR